MDEDALRSAFNRHIPRSILKKPGEAPEGGRPSPELVAGIAPDEGIEDRELASADGKFSMQASEIRKLNDRPDDGMQKPIFNEAGELYFAPDMDRDTYFRYHAMRAAEGLAEICDHNFESLSEGECANFISVFISLYKNLESVLADNVSNYERKNRRLTTAFSYIPLVSWGLGLKELPTQGALKSVIEELIPALTLRHKRLRRQAKLKANENLAKQKKELEEKEDADDESRRLKFGPEVKRKDGGRSMEDFELSEEEKALRRAADGND